ncbi:uroporphyrinogen-III synthase [Sutterella sp.]|uniref:uroporphyrinogen-III synthase n=1 Tax=Sutterella sp. TaxID=1981025 RepID=UPI0026DEFA05|nr:uroporphyrinogen-III synthase [Sutterella sp.]MDO5531533.1 uroporphyrinogen-III synthase [Sutterella sp.]
MRTGTPGQRPVILMRPGEANNRLAELLSADCADIWRWPAFTIELPEETEIVAERLAHLDDFEMVVLPSPSSVTAVAHWVREWPAHITLATVGEGTARVIRAAWGDEVKLIYPEGAAEKSGSEALWTLVQAHGAPSRVLFLRGQTGREWLPDQFRRIGSDVVVLCAYVRVPLELSAQDLQQLQQATSGPSPVVYITSTDAVDVLMHAVRPVQNGREWLTRGVAVTIHPRVMARLKEAGFRHVEITETGDQDVRAHVLANLRAD